MAAWLRSVTRTRLSCDARRVNEHVNREFDVQYNLKRIRRVMWISGRKAARPMRRRTGAAHTSDPVGATVSTSAGVVMRLRSRAGTARPFRLASLRSFMVARPSSMWKCCGISVALNACSSNEPWRRDLEPARGSMLQCSCSTIMARCPSRSIR